MVNSRYITASKALRFSLQLLFWIPITLGSFLLVKNTIPYFSFNLNFDFLQERALLLENKIWLYSFYIHIFAGMWCITTVLVQFSGWILKKRKSVHVWSGRIYVFVVLFLGAPTGLYMAFFAKGSYWEKACFLFMALTWFYSTYSGMVSIRNKQVLAHKFWMLRSYALSLTAVTFRIYHLIFFYLGAEHHFNYAISLWISVIGNLLFAEWLIYRQSKSYLQTFKNEYR